jgi:hypothetical protein
MRYPIDVKPDGKFFLVTFPDIPEAITQGKSLKEAKDAATSGRLGASRRIGIIGRNTPAAVTTY